MASIDDLKTWFERDLKFATWDENIQVDEFEEKKIAIKFYTDVNEYMLEAEQRDDGDVLVSGMARSRKPRAGMTTSRVRHLLPAPKPLNAHVWRRILGAIVGLELVRVRRRETAEAAAEPAVDAAVEPAAEPAAVEG
jgi:hypothetical protein